MLVIDTSQPESNSHTFLILKMYDAVSKPLEGGVRPAAHSTTPKQAAATDFCTRCQEAFAHLLTRTNGLANQDQSRL
jgi:hypothetical protein